jgi:hypothetical protein
MGPGFHGVLGWFERDELGLVAARLRLTLPRSAVAGTMRRCAGYGRHTFTSGRPQPTVPGLEWSLGLGVVHTGVEAGPGEMPPGSGVVSTGAGVMGGGMGH